MSAWQFAKMLYAADRLGVPRFICMQNHYNVVYREEEREMFPLCRAEGVAITPYSPMARGFVAGDRRTGDFGDTVRAKVDEYSKGLYFQPEDFRIVGCLTEVARKRGISNARLALAWVLQQPGVVAPIIGATKLPQLDDSLDALQVKLDEEELRVLAADYRPHPVLVGRRG